MFPKAHAAAYVMMAWRVAYCKVFYPLAYYCAYFSIRANAFDYEKMAMGRDKLEYFIDDYKNKKSLGTITNTEEDELKDMRIVQEMYARGYDFMPIDIYRAKAKMSASCSTATSTRAGISATFHLDTVAMTATAIPALFSGGMAASVSS